MLTKERYESLRFLSIGVNSYMLNKARAIFDEDEGIVLRTDVGIIKKGAYSKVVFLDGYEVGQLDLSRSNIGSAHYMPWMIATEVEGERLVQYMEWKFELNQ
jgi:hypothetical protein